MSNPLFILTEEKLAEWRAEKKRGEEMIAEGQRIVSRVDAKLTAAANLLEALGEGRPKDTNLTPGSATLTLSNSSPSLNLTETIEKLANQSVKPVPQAELREILTKRGFPDSQLSNYFYTVISRLKKARRITSTKRGVWKAPQQQAEFQELRAPSALSSTGDRSTPYSDAGGTQPGEPRAQGREAGPGGGT
jgi:hypothetical protein